MSLFSWVRQAKVWKTQQKALRRDYQEGVDFINQKGRRGIEAKFWN